jgi:hypothetical protein
MCASGTQPLTSRLGAKSPPGSTSALEGSVGYGFARRVAFSWVRMFQDCFDRPDCEFTGVSSVLPAYHSTALSFRLSQILLRPTWCPIIDVFIPRRRLIIRRRRVTSVSGCTAGRIGHSRRAICLRACPTFVLWSARLIYRSRFWLSLWQSGQRHTTLLALVAVDGREPLSAIAEVLE